MDDFINVITKDPKIRIKINDMLDRYMKLSYKYQSKIRYDTLFQNVVLKELINIMGTTTTDLDIELKMKISRIIYLESKLISINEINKWFNIIVKQDIFRRLQRR